MRAQDMIKAMLTMIDGGQTTQISIEPAVVTEPEQPGELSPLSATASDDINRFKQIIDLANDPAEAGAFANEPNEQYADIDAVTVDAGGGVNGPKHPHDLRVKDPSAYPHTQDQSNDMEPHTEKTGLHGALINAMRGL